MIPFPLARDEMPATRAVPDKKCACCRVRLRGKGQIDHIIALACGGTNDASNLQLMCRTCNSAKRASDPIEFMQSRGMLL